VTALPVSARPPYKQALIDLFGTDLPTKLRDCRTCHLPAKPGDEENDRPHNLFGTRLKALRDEHKKAGKKTDITARLLASLEEDTDRDGVRNGLELLAGHLPGDPADKPDAATLTVAQQKLARWQASRRDNYAWQPFEPVVRPAVPALPRGWGRNPIDAFLAVEHDRRALVPRPEASRQVLLRRVYFDLVGLPPTREEMNAFLNDSSPDAYEKVVDRLLNSPRHGERWGRHWMDVWRYSDWAGYGAEVRDSQKHIWRWRDWIIGALNRDKSYDRMIQEMLAADELAPLDTEALPATGFLVRNWYRFNRNVWLDRIVEHTGKAFLGVTLNCARCHDHFYDPITMKDYYAFRAVFEPHDVRTDRLPHAQDINVDGLPRVFDAKPNAPTYLFERGDEAHPNKTRTIAPAVPSALGGTLAIKPVALPRLAYQPDRQPFIVEQTISQSQSALLLANKQAAIAQRRLLATVAPPFCTAGTIVWSAIVQRTSDELNLAKLDVNLADARHKELLAQIEAENNDSKEAKQAILEVQKQVRLLSEQRTALVKKLYKKPPPAPGFKPRTVPTYPATSTGRRLALAKWITDQGNPLTARVLVNHVWLRHFGKPIVPTEFDFGRNGQPPTHPALLDWLAAEFMENDWSMKKLHRLIVTSAAYRMDSSANEAMFAKDPDNRYLWRMNPRRMEGEVIRDSLLALAGRLDGTMGGPDVDHQQGLATPRRSVYFRHAAEKQMEFLLLFDAASVNECYRRTESIIPQQALALSNSTLAVGMSRLLAGQLWREAENDPSAFVRQSYAHILGRPPTASEMSTCEEFLAEQSALLADPRRLTPFTSGPSSSIAASSDPRQRSRENLIHVLLNLNEFVTIR
jgi:hypothetical protein